MSNQIHCPHCKQPFSHENPPKALINCPHNLCLTCLQQQILCPIDRVRIQVRRYTLNAFKTNQELLDKIDKLKSSPQAMKSARSKKSSSVQKNTSKDKKMKSSSKKITQQSKVQKTVAVQPFDLKQQTLTSQQTPAQSQISQKIYRSPLLSKKQSQSPKKPADNFQTCLLHSKKADLICMQDKCLICANCGLFGQHKHHTIIPFEDFLNQYSILTQQCFKNYEELQNRQQKMNLQLIEQQVTALLTQKKNQQIKQIRLFIRELNQLVKKTQKELMNNLDLIVSYKKNKIIQSINFKDLQSKKKQFMMNVQGMTQGLEYLFNLENVEKYVPYIDPNNAQSYILEQGEYLIRQIDNYTKTVHQKLQQDIIQFKYAFEPVNQDLFSSFFSIESLQSQKIAQFISKNKQCNNVRSGTPSRSKSFKDSTNFGKETQLKESINKQNEDNTLLLGLDSVIESPKYQQISPIQPLSNVLNVEFAPQTNTGPQGFFKITESLHPDFVSSKSYRKSSGKPPVNKSFNPSKTSRHLRLQSCQSQLSHISIHHKSKPKSNNNSNHLTQRQLLNVLNQKSDNKRKKKLDLPEKYAKIYDQLYKDKLDIVDLGGAYLGDNNILAISQLFLSSRGKLKQIKLMNNKISDDIFPELISRCRNVTSLNLSYNTLTQKCLDWLQAYAEHVGQLRNITLSNNKIVLRNNRQRIEQLKRRGLNVSL